MLPKGQSAAALALGLRLPQTYRYALLPQALRIVIPPLTAELLSVLKNSAVASPIGLMELLAQTKQTAEFSADLFEAFTLATLIYFVLNMGPMLLMRLVEKRLAAGQAPAAPAHSTILAFGFPNAAGAAIRKTGRRAAASAPNKIKYPLFSIG